MKLKARTIDTWVVRSPAPKNPTAPMVPPVGPNEQAHGGVKYQLEKAHCDGMVSVHQDPEDPTKPRGTDILGSQMVIDSTPDGSVLTVLGWDNRPGEVHNEGTSLIGPKIVVDQLHNLAVIEGRGSVAIPSSSGLTGTELKNGRAGRHPLPRRHDLPGGAQDRRVLRQGQRLPGQFVGDVPHDARQLRSPGLLHPVQPAEAPRKDPKGGDDKPRLDIVDCYPAPGDTADSPQEKIVTFTQVERDPATGRAIRQQQIEAQELRLEALAVEPEGGESYRRVTADGPGIVRTWAPGSRDDGARSTTSARQPSGPPPQPAVIGNETHRRELLRPHDRQGQGGPLQGGDVHPRGPGHPRADRGPGHRGETEPVAAAGGAPDLLEQPGRLDAQGGERAGAAIHARPRKRLLCRTRSTRGGERSSRARAGSCGSSA